MNGRARADGADWPATRRTDRLRRRAAAASAATACCASDPPLDAGRDDDGASFGRGYARPRAASAAVRGRSGSSASARARPCAVLVLGEQVEGRERATADPLERPLARDLGLLVEPLGRSTVEAGGARARRSSCVGRGKRSTVDAANDGKNGCSQCRSKRDGVHRRDDGAAVAASTRRSSANARGRSNRCTAIRMTARSNQPPLNGSALGRAPRFGVDAVRARDRDHLLRRVDAPDAGDLPLGERGREPARAAADIEHAPAAQVAGLDDRVEDLPPALVDRPQLVVGRGDAREVSR